MDEGLVDCAEFRAAIAITARAGPSYVDATGEPKLIARTPDCDYTLDDMVAEWCKLKTALLTKSFGMNDKSAFTVKACQLPPFEWARAYLNE